MIYLRWVFKTKNDYFLVILGPDDMNDESIICESLFYYNFQHFYDVLVLERRILLGVASRIPAVKVVVMDTTSTPKGLCSIKSNAPCWKGIQ
jgi:hypothetical protein